MVKWFRYGKIKKNYEMYCIYKIKNKKLEINFIIK